MVTGKGQTFPAHRHLLTQECNMTIHYTYDPNDITSTGFRIQTGPRRTIISFRSRWQGSRNGYRITIHGDARSDIQNGMSSDYDEISAEIDCAIDRDTEGRGIHRGQHLRLWGHDARV